MKGIHDRRLLADVIAGITVGVIALPLAMAFGIGSIPDNVVRSEGVSPPAMGLYTAVVAGFLISALGGSRVQIGGPTGAFIVIVSGGIARVSWLRGSGNRDDYGRRNRDPDGLAALGGL